MLDPSSNPPSSDTAVADAASALSSPALATGADSSAKPPSNTSDPVQVALPDEDEAEQAWHKATLIAEEDIREQVIIPGEFATKHIWSPFVPATEESSPSTPGAHPVSHVIIPPALLADAHAALSTALSSDTQLASVPPKPTSPPVPEDSSSSTAPVDPPSPPSDPEPLNEPIVTLFCPFDHGSGVIDTIVSGVGLSQRADVLVLDALMFAQGEASPLGPGLENFMKDLYRVGDSNDDDFRSRQVQRYLRALINVDSPVLAYGETKTEEEIHTAEQRKAESSGKTAEGSSTSCQVDTEASQDSKSSGDREEKAMEETKEGEDEDSEDDANRPRSRIIYVRDFGGIASHSQPLLKELILAVRARRTAIQPGADSPGPYDPKKIQPTAIILGVSYSPENTPHNCCSSCTWSRFTEGFESSDQDKLCQLLPDILQPSISKTTDDISRVIADAIFAAPKRVSYSERTLIDPDVGTGAIYRQIICAYGFSDSRDPHTKSKKGDKGSKKSNDNLWRKGDSTGQKEHKERFGVMRFTRNEQIVRKALSSLGGKMQEGVGMFSALPEAEESENVDDEKGKGKKKATEDNNKGKKDKKKKKKTKEELEAEKYTTITGLKENLLSRAVAERVAAIALHGLPTTLGGSSKRKGSAPPPRKPSKEGHRVVSPEDIAAAIKASLIGNDQRKKWLDSYQKLKNEGDPNEKDDSEEEEKKKEDPILAKVRASGTLTSHEERLIGGVIDTTQLATGFDDVCIDSKIVDGVRMIISLPLMYPKAFASGILGAEALSGILLYGPPGTGKTMLCRAIAKECNVRMLLVAPSTVQDMYVGETEKLVKAIFTLARKIAPCVVFIDEVDAIFGARSSDNTNGARYHRSMLTEFMQEMDGLNSAAVNKKKGIVVVTATNRPFDLDDAVLRRLPRRMLLDLPGPKEREQILKVHLKGENMEGIDLTDLARRTNNFSGSDLKNLAVCAALASLKDVIPDMWKSKKTLKLGKEKVKDKDEAKEDEKEDLEADADDDEEDEDSDDEETPEVAPRILRPIHFKAAFEQVSATCSRDMASVQKLRNWASQFSRDSGAGLGAIPTPATPNGHAHPGAATTATASPTGGNTGSTTTAGTGSTYRGLTGGGDGLWDHRYETNMLSRFSNLPRPGGGSGGTGGSGANGSSSTTGRGAGGSGSGSGL